MRKGDDVFGRALMDWARGGTAPEIIEREDGFTDLSAGHDLYISGFKDWPSSERSSIRYVRGRVIDVGCGAGRVSLYLQQRGFDVVGLDASPLAVRSAQLRGVKQTWCLSIDELSKRLELFDTIVLFGNNFGILVLLSECKRHYAFGPVGRSPVLVSWPRALIPTLVALPRLTEAISERTSWRAVCPGSYEYDPTTEVVSAHGPIGYLFRARRCGSS
jgi:SAM-dependent methyltransferase